LVVRYIRAGGGGGGVWVLRGVGRQEKIKGGGGGKKKGGGGGGGGALKKIQVEPATSRFLAQHLNCRATAVPIYRPGKV